MSNELREMERAINNSWRYREIDDEVDLLRDAEEAMAEMEVDERIDDMLDDEFDDLDYDQDYQEKDD